MAVWVKKHRANIASSTLRVSWSLFVGASTGDTPYSFCNAEGGNVVEVTS